MSALSSSHARQVSILILFRVAFRFFVQQVAEFDPKASAPVRSAAPLLSSAIRDLGVITADLVESFPKLEACRASLLDQGAGEHNSTSQWASAAALLAASTSSASASADDSAIQVSSCTLRTDDRVRVRMESHVESGLVCIGLRNCTDDRRGARRRSWRSGGHRERGHVLPWDGLRRNRCVGSTGGSTAQRSNAAEEFARCQADERMAGRR